MKKIILHSLVVTVLAFTSNATSQDIHFTGIFETAILNNHPVIPDFSKNAGLQPRYLTQRKKSCISYNDAVKGFGEFKKYLVYQKTNRNFFHINTKEVPVLKMNTIYSSKVLAS